MSKIPLALLPGTLCSADLWSYQAEALSEIADVYIVDTSKHDTLITLAEHVHDIMPARFAVADLSYGGIVAFAVWRHRPAAKRHLDRHRCTFRQLFAPGRWLRLYAINIGESGSNNGLRRFRWFF